MIIDAIDANVLSKQIDDFHFYLKGVEAKIVEAIMDDKFHAEWYSPAREDYNPAELFNLIELLEEKGYGVISETYEPTSDFPNTRCKLKISWD